MSDEHGCTPQPAVGDTMWRPTAVCDMPHSDGDSATWTFSSLCEMPSSFLVEATRVVEPRRQRHACRSSGRLACSNSCARSTQEQGAALHVRPLLRCFPGTCRGSPLGLVLSGAHQIIMTPGTWTRASCAAPPQLWKEGYKPLGGCFRAVRHELVHHHGSLPAASDTHFKRVRPAAAVPVFQRLLGSTGPNLCYVHLFVIE